MAERDYSAYQKKVIQRYYQNREQMDEQRLSELVTSLYLASPKQAARQWGTVQELLERLELPESRIEHIMSKKDPAILASVVEELQKGTLVRRKKT